MSFEDGGYRWRYLRLWPTQRHLVWCVELFGPGHLKRYLRTLHNSAGGPRHGEECGVCREITARFATSDEEPKQEAA